MDTSDYNVQPYEHSNVEGFEDEQTDLPPPPRGGEDDRSNAVSYGRPMEEQPQGPRREFKYSTASMPERSRCRRWCMIILMFLTFMLITMAISWLINKLFFDKQSDNAPTLPERPANETFPKDKVYVDQACSVGTIASDDGAVCRQTCEPQFSACCDPFDEYKLYNFTEFGKNATTSYNNTTSDNNNTMTDFNLTSSNQTCSLDVELRGCMSYAKCQALGGLIDPAPSTLSILCNKENLQKDPVSCSEVCKRVECCFDDTIGSCLMDNFDICMDYAPCQNLRDGFTLETAPDDLDRACFYQLPECFDTCEKADCCGDAENSCLQDNFLSCLTYAPCSNVTMTNVTLAPQFSVVERPPQDLLYACTKRLDSHPTNKTCEEYCTAASCCWEEDPTSNCFLEDPLGCLTWEQQCRVVLDNL